MNRPAARTGTGMVFTSRAERIPCGILAGGMKSMGSFLVLIGAVLFWA